MNSCETSVAIEYGPIGTVQRYIRERTLAMLEGGTPKEKAGRMKAEGRRMTDEGCHAFTPQAGKHARIKVDG